MLSLSKFSCSSNKQEYVKRAKHMCRIDSIHCKGIHVTC